MGWLEAGQKRQSQSVPFSFVNYFFVCRNMGIQFRGQLVGVKSSIPLCGSHRWSLSGLTAGILAHTGLSCGFSLQPMFARASEDGPDSCPPDYPAEGLGHHVWTFRIPHRNLWVLAYVSVHRRSIKPEPESTETCGGKWLQQRRGTVNLHTSVALSSFTCSLAA